MQFDPSAASPAAPTRRRPPPGARCLGGGGGPPPRHDALQDFLLDLIFFATANFEWLAIVQLLSLIHISYPTKPY